MHILCIYYRGREGFQNLGGKIYATRTYFNIYMEKNYSPMD